MYVWKEEEEEGKNRSSYRLAIFSLRSWWLRPLINLISFAISADMVKEKRTGRVPDGGNGQKCLLLLALCFFLHVLAGNLAAGQLHGLPHVPETDEITACRRDGWEQDRRFGRDAGGRKSNAKSEAHWRRSGSRTWPCRQKKKLKESRVERVPGTTPQEPCRCTG